MPDIDDKIFDRLDYRILRALVANARMTDVMLSEQIGLSANAVARRRRALEEAGVIKGYSADLDTTKVGFGIDIIVQISLNAQSDDALSEFESAVQQCQSVSGCSFVSGDRDFLLLVNARSLEDYDQTYRQELASLPHVARIQSSFVLRHVMRRTVAPVVLVD